MGVTCKVPRAVTGSSFDKGAASFDACGKTTATIDILVMIVLVGLVVVSFVLVIFIPSEPFRRSSITAGRSRAARFGRDTQHTVIENGDLSPFVPRRVFELGFQI